MQARHRVGRRVCRACPGLHADPRSARQKARDGAHFVGGAVLGQEHAPDGSLISARAAASSVDGAFGRCVIATAAALARRGNIVGYQYLGAAGGRQERERVRLQEV